jgi:predicted transcriptional regulator
MAGCVMAAETRLVMLVLQWLRENGPGTAPRIARAICRDAGLVNASLRKYESAGRVRRVGLEPNPPGRPSVIYELVEQDRNEVSEMDSENGSMAAANTERGSATDEEMAAAAATVELTADDMDELLNGYCGSVTLCEADSRVLLFVLRMRRVQDTLREVEAAAA